MELPASTLAVFDSEGEAFGYVRIAPDPTRDDRIDCIFDVEATNAAQGLRSEVRWLCKRHFQQKSEHRLVLGNDGTVTIKKGDFKLVLEPEEEGDGLQSRAPSPPITAIWED